VRSSSRQVLAGSRVASLFPGSVQDLVDEPASIQPHESDFVIIEQLEPHQRFIVNYRYIARFQGLEGMMQTKPLNNRIVIIRFKQ